MTRTARLLLGATLLVAVNACSSSDPAAQGDPNPTFTGASIATTSSTPSGLSVALRSSPATPARGTDAVELVVRDASGAPVTGLTIEVVPWMPAMGHGASLTPVTRDAGGGTYVVTGVAMVMPGTWELRLTLTDATRGVLDHATISLTIS